MTWFPKNTTLEDKLNYYINEVGLLPVEANAYLTPVSQYSKELFQLAMQAERKTNDYFEKINEQYKKDNPEKYMTVSERQVYNADKKEKENSKSAECCSESFSKPLVSSEKAA